MQAETLGGVKVIARKLEGVTREALRDFADQLRDKHSPIAIILGAEIDGKVSLIAAVSKPLVKEKISTPATSSRPPQRSLVERAADALTWPKPGRSWSIKLTKPSRLEQLNLRSNSGRSHAPRISPRLAAACLWYCSFSAYGRVDSPHGEPRLTTYNCARNFCASLSLTLGYETDHVKSAPGLIRAYYRLPDTLESERRVPQ